VSTPTEAPLLREVRATAVPVQHWCRRGMFDKNDCLWAGYVVQSGGRKFFFAGDTGYCPAFKEIGQVCCVCACAIPSRS
jgi:L-ascorbate metabolism protein UlaG (beta-lactamase superfamily)